MIRSLLLQLVAQRAGLATLHHAPTHSSKEVTVTAHALPKEGGMNPITAKIVIGGAVIAATPPRTPAMVERVRGASILGRGQMKGIGIRLGITILRRATPLHHLATPALKRATTSTGSRPPAPPTTTPPKIATDRPKETTDNTEAARQRTVATTKIEAIATDPARVVAPPTGTTDTDLEQVVTLPETTDQGVARDTETASETVSAHRGATVIVTTGSTGEAAEIGEMRKRGSRGRGVRMLLSGEKL